MMPPAGRVALIPVMLSLCLNVASFVLFKDHMMSDSDGYLAPVSGLMAERAFHDASGRPETERTPGYPIFLAALFSLSLGTRAAVLAQHLILLVLVGVTASMTYRVCGSRVAATTAGVLLALDLPSIEAANTVLSETVMTAAVLAAVWQTYRAATGEPPRLARHAAAAGLLWGGAVLIRPVALFYGAPRALFFLLAAGRGRGLRAACAALLAFCVFPGCWILRNYRLTRHATISTISGQGMLLFRAAGALAADDPGDFDANLTRRQRELEKRACADLERMTGRSCGELSMLDREAYYFKLGIGVILRAPGGYVKEALREFLMIVFGGGADLIVRAARISARAAQGACLFFTVPVAALALSGLRYWFARDRAMFWLLLLTVGYFFVVPAGAEAYSRFRVPVMPLYAMLAGGGMARLRDRGSRSLTRKGRP